MWLYPKNKLLSHAPNSTWLYGGEEARARVTVELHALDIDVAILRRAPQFEQNIPSGTIWLSVQCGRAAEDVPTWQDEI